MKRISVVTLLVIFFIDNSGCAYTKLTQKTYHYEGGYAYSYEVSTFCAYCKDRYTFDLEGDQGHCPKCGRMLLTVTPSSVLYNTLYGYGTTPRFPQYHFSGSSYYHFVGSVTLYFNKNGELMATNVSSYESQGNYIDRSQQENVYYTGRNYNISGEIGGKGVRKNK